MEAQDYEFYQKNNAIMRMALKRGEMDISMTARWIVAPESVTYPYLTNGALAPTVEFKADLSDDQKNQVRSVSYMLKRQLPMIAWRLLRADILSNSDKFYIDDMKPKYNVRDIDALSEYRESLRNWPSHMQSNGIVVKQNYDTWILGDVRLANDSSYWPPLPDFKDSRISSYFQ